MDPDAELGGLEYLRPHITLQSKQNRVPLRCVALRQALGKVLYRSQQIPDLSIFEEDVYQIVRTLPDRKMQLQGEKKI